MQCASGFLDSPKGKINVSHRQEECDSLAESRAHRACSIWWRFCTHINLQTLLAFMEHVNFCFMKDFQHVVMQRFQGEPVLFS